MADKTGIEWADATWNPITGCSVVSPGCTNCYAMKLAGGRMKNHPSRAGLTRDSKAGPVWTGEVRFNEDWLDQPIRWKRPRTIFVCAHGDLFHQDVPEEWLDRIFAVMALSPQHNFQVLTKRATRMRDYMQKLYHNGRYLLWPHPTVGGSASPAFHKPFERLFPNVWLGVSAEDQKRADERIPQLLDTPAAVRFVSAEPLLGPIDLTRISPKIFAAEVDALTGTWRWDGGPTRTETPGLDWVIAGGESGAGARPMHPRWVRSLRDQCKRAKVAFHFKQWGSWLPYEEDDAGVLWPASATDPRDAIEAIEGHDVFNERPRGWLIGYPGDPVYRSMQKSHAGRKIDGHTWDEMPRRKAAQ